MRFVGLGVLLIGCLVAAEQASAQALGGGMRRNKGDVDQHQTGTSAPIQKEEKKFPLGQSWIAVSLNGKTIGGTERPAFALDEQFRVRGFGGCNSFSATAYPLKEQGIAVGPLAMTKRSCDKGVMASEQAFLGALRSSAKWDTVVGTLVIKGPSGELRFERSM